jgi:hypothetical protein
MPDWQTRPWPETLVSGSVFFHSSTLFKVVEFTSHYMTFLYCEYERPRRCHRSFREISLEEFQSSIVHGVKISSHCQKTIDKLHHRLLLHAAILRYISGVSLNQSLDFISSTQGFRLRPNGRIYVQAKRAKRPKILGLAYAYARENA